MALKINSAFDIRPRFNDSRGSICYLAREAYRNEAPVYPKSIRFSGGIHTSNNPPAISGSEEHSKLLLCYFEVDLTIITYEQS